MAYTKYSLTPADNNAAPPNGAPEGMLPSGVNDTMRDMMSQIRDVGDGIRGGTYTMTAPVITGGSINDTVIGATTATTATFTTATVNRVADSQGGSVAPISSVMRNRIINGGMVINQRGGTVTFGTGGEYFVDRWTGNNGGGATITAQQSTTAPSGFINSLLVNTSVGGSPTSGQLRVVRQKIEGLNVSDLGWGTASAKTITVSFWIRSNLTGTFACYVTNSAFNRSQVNTFVINSANTFEYKTVTFVGDTSGTWLTTNGTGIEFGIDIGSGTDFNATAGVWNAAYDTRTSGAVTLSSTTSNNLYLTGVQLEVGTQATSFEYRQYGQELALCQRYFYNSTTLGIYACTNGSSYAIPEWLPVVMRAAPTLTNGTVTSNIGTTSFAASTPTVNRLTWTLIANATGAGNVTFTYTASSEL